MYRCYMSEWKQILLPGNSMTVVPVWCALISFLKEAVWWSLSLLIGWSVIQVQLWSCCFLERECLFFPGLHLLKPTIDMLSLSIFSLILLAWMPLWWTVTVSILLIRKLISCSGLPLWWLSSIYSYTYYEIQLIV